MKKRILLLLAALGVTAFLVNEREKQKAAPYKLIYRRLYEEALETETEEPDIVEEILEAVKEVKTGEESDIFTTDHTDILIFVYEDGKEIAYEFEGDCLVSEDGKRYKAEGLKQLRVLLNKLIGE